MGVSETTTHMVLKDCDEGRPMQRKSVSRRPGKNMKKVRVRALIRYLDGKVGLSQRQAAKKIGVSRSYAAKIKKEKSNIRYFRRQPLPAAKEEQKKKQKLEQLKKQKKDYINGGTVAEWSRAWRYHSS